MLLKEDYEEIGCMTWEGEIFAIYKGKPHIFNQYDGSFQKFIGENNIK